MKRVIGKIANKDRWVVFLTCGILAVGVLISGLLIVLRIPNTEIVSDDNKTDEFIETVTAVFLNEDGTEYDRKSVNVGSYVHPPKNPVKGVNTVFRGWNQDLLCMSEDNVFYPMMEDLSDDVNAIYIDTYYADTNEEIWVDLVLCGKIKLARLPIEIKYDPEVLTFKTSDSSYRTVTQREDGILSIQINEEANLTENEVLARICFQAKDIGLVKTDLIIGNGIPKYLSAGNEVAYDCTTVNGSIYILN